MGRRCRAAGEKNIKTNNCAAPQATKNSHFKMLFAKTTHCLANALCYRGVIISNLLLTRNDKWGGGSSFAPAKMVNARGGIVIRGGGGFKMTLV